MVLLATALLSLPACERMATPRDLALPDWQGAWTSTGGAALPLGALERGGELPLLRSPEPMLTPKYRARYETALASFGRGGTRMAKCLPAGMPGLLDHSNTFEILMTQGRVTMIFEDGELRRIHTDGRKHPPTDQLYTNIQGHSIGRWEGETLVVDTAGMSRNAELFVASGLTVTPTTHIVERMYLRSDGLLQIDTVVTDPEVFVQPHSYSKTFQQLGLDDFEPGCNGRDTIEQVDLTPPPFEPLP